MYKAILFDLDGTLTESGEGITKCVQYALEKIGKPEENLKNTAFFSVLLLMCCSPVFMQTILLLPLQGSRYPLHL